MRKTIACLLIVLEFSLVLFHTVPEAGGQALAPGEMPAASSLILRNIAVYLDGAEVSLNYAAFIDASERAVISLDDCRLIFGTRIELLDTRLLLCKGPVEFLLKEGEYLRLPPALIEKNLGAGVRLNGSYLPMRFVAEQLGYGINYNSRAGAVSLRSYGYQGPDPQFPLPLPPRLPADLPRWGSLAGAPVMAGLWPVEKIIGGYYTSVAGSPAPRANNIRLSCGKLNGAVIESGAVFSFNHTVGQRTAAGGYQAAGIIVGRRVVPGIGGGICQTSSTLYNSVLEAGLPVLERHAHNLRVAYVPVDRDATVSWGTADMKFRNSKPYPLKILARVYGDYVIIALAALR